MPLAEEFDAAAATFDAAAQATVTLAEPARAALGAGVMTGGQLTDHVADELAAAAAILDEVGAELARLAATCRERAETCRQALAAGVAYDASYTDYQAELRDWQDAGGTGTAPPEPPTPPPAAPEWANR